MSGHIKNRVKSIIFLLVVKKKREGPALFSRPIKNKVMVAEAPNGTPPVFLLYYDIVAYFYIVCIP